jgi:murein DD-endopeptidase MepM/ murein hydrolase activator NlpD
MYRGVRPFAFAATPIAVVLVTLSVSSAPPGDNRTFYLRDRAGEMGGGFADDIEAPGDPSQTFRPSDTRVGTRAARVPYTFFPHAGIEGQDLFFVNFVDLGNGAFDHTQPGRDYECTGYSYGGHSGHDSIVQGFREQDIGVPIFAALDGTVYGVHDGEPDRETVNLVGRPNNFVALQHADGYQSVYLHLKRGSISVALGRTVVAGTQIGLTGSSGDSSWPHLHFTSMLNGTAYEPSAGACRPGDSNWTRQSLLKRDTYATSFTWGTQPFTGNAGYPFDEVTRRGTYVSGTTPIYFRFGLHNLPPDSTYRFLLVRPDGTAVMDNSGAFGNAQLVKNAWFWFSRAVTTVMTGTWTLDIFINGQNVMTAPLSVVASTTEVVNHPPLPIAWVALDPPAPSPTDVPMCLVRTGSLYRRDPDYDLVRYRYRWFVNGAVVREVTSAGLADALPAGTIQARDELRCEVTPRDEALEGPTVSMTAGTPSQQIPAGGSIQSDNAFYRLLYQAEGNLILTDERSHTVMWATNTDGSPAGRLVMQDDGNLVLYDVSGRIAWASNTPGNAGAYFALENDGNLVIYSAVGQRIWDRYR